MSEPTFNDEPDDYYPDDDDGYCDECGGEGWILTCCDDICHGLGYCMHGDGMEMCACNDGCEPPSNITPEQDALVTSWEGRTVWVNPPYSQISRFVKRAWEQCQEQRNTIVLLIPAYTDPAYWYDCIVPFADEIRFLVGRVSFLENGVRKTSARFPSVVIVFRWRQGEFKKPPHVWWWKWRIAPSNGQQKGPRQWAVRTAKPNEERAPLLAQEIA